MKAAKSKAIKKKAGGARPYNRYNCFFILERERIVLEKGGSSKWSSGPRRPSACATSPDPFVRGYAGLVLPPLPSRFAHMTVPEDWCVPGRQKKRRHRRTHGVATFQELAEIVARHWKEVDTETFEFCSQVEKALKQRHQELTEKLGDKDGSGKKPERDKKPKKQVENARAKQGKPEETKPKQHGLKQAKSRQDEPGQVRLQTKARRLPPRQIDPERVEPEQVRRANSAWPAAAATAPPPIPAVLPQLFSPMRASVSPGSSTATALPEDAPPDNAPPEDVPPIIKEFFGDDEGFFWDASRQFNNVNVDNINVENANLKAEQSGLDEFAATVAGIHEPLGDGGAEWWDAGLVSDDCAQEMLWRLQEG